MINQIQIIAYADDIAIIGNRREDLIRAIDQLDKEAKKLGLEINEEKTKYMKIGRENMHTQNDLQTKEYTFEEVNTFNYLGVTVGQAGKNRVKERILKGNQAYGRNKTLLKSKTISKITKIKIYKTLIRPVITYAMETVTINKKEEEDLKIVERKVMRAILGPNVTRDGEVRLRRNKEIEEELGGENITRHIKVQRLRWAGHIMRRKPTAMIRRVTEWIPIWPRNKGRPRKRWRDALEEDTKALGVRDWKSKCRDRKEWKKITEAARTNKLEI